MQGIFEYNVLFDSVFLQLQTAGEDNKNTKRVAESQSFTTIILATAIGNYGLHSRSSFIH